MPLTLRQIEDKCLWGKGASQCRYLAQDDKDQFYCIKKTAMRTEIDKEVSEFKKRQKSQGVNPNALDLPLGDNCGGYTFFRHKMQGYDLPS